MKIIPVVDNPGHLALAEADEVLIVVRELCTANIDEVDFETVSEDGNGYKVVPNVPPR